MKALTVGGAMIDTIAIIANDRIEYESKRDEYTPFEKWDGKSTSLYDRDFPDEESDQEYESD